MAQRVPTPRTDFDDTVYSITLGGVEIRYRLRWMPRPSGWYMRVTQPDGVTVVSDWTRLRPGGRCTLDDTADGHPPGVLWCVGASDGTQRDDLWDDMQIVFDPDGVV